MLRLSYSLLSSSLFDDYAPIRKWATNNNKAGKEFTRRALIEPIESDLSDLGKGIEQHAVVNRLEYEKERQHEDFFVVWNRIYQLASDVAPLIHPDYIYQVTEAFKRKYKDRKKRGKDAERSDTPADIVDSNQEELRMDSEYETFNYFKYLLQNGDPAKYVPKYADVQYVSNANRFMDRGELNPDQKVVNSEQRPFVVFLNSDMLELFVDWIKEEVVLEIPDQGGDQQQQRNNNEERNHDEEENLAQRRAKRKEILDVLREDERKHREEMAANYDKMNARQRRKMKEEHDDIINQLKQIEKEEFVPSQTSYRPFILVTGWNDPGPDDFLKGSQFLLKLPFLHKWWAQNCDQVSPGVLKELEEHGEKQSSGDDNNVLTSGGVQDDELIAIGAKNKMQCLPIGVDWHSVARGPRWGLPQLSALQQVERMHNLAKEKNFILSALSTPTLKQHHWSFLQRKNKIILDFALGSNTKTRFWTWFDLTFWNPVCNFGSFLTKSVWGATRDQVWQNYLDYRFVLSPPGNGYECHRTYEAIILGAIPIVQLHPRKELRPLIAQVYQDLPVVFVEDYSCATINWKNVEKWNKFAEEFWSNDVKVEKMKKKLSNRYWLQKIRGDY